MTEYEIVQRQRIHNPVRAEGESQQDYRKRQRMSAQVASAVRRGHRWARSN
jgi:hypothetical protein